MRALVEQLRASPARLGAVRLVCVDGPAGSGKTTFAGRLAAALGPGAEVLHMDDLYAGWTLTGAAARLAAGVLRPLAEGGTGGYHRYDWAARRFAAEASPVPVPEVLVVEGCGSSPAHLDPWTTLRVWVEAPAQLRLVLGLARDGAEHEAVWRAWLRAEALWFAADRTRARAQFLVDGGSQEPR